MGHYLADMFDSWEDRQAFVRACLNPRDRTPWICLPGNAEILTKLIREKKDGLEHKNSNTKRSTKGRKRKHKMGGLGPI